MLKLKCVIVCNLEIKGICYKQFNLNYLIKLISNYKRQKDYNPLFYTFKKYRKSIETLFYQLCDLGRPKGPGKSKLDKYKLEIDALLKNDLLKDLLLSDIIQLPQIYIIGSKKNNL